MHAPKEERCAGDDHEDDEGEANAAHHAPRPPRFRVAARLQERLRRRRIRVIIDVTLLLLLLLLLLDVIVIFILLSASVVERRRLCRLLQICTFRSVSPLHGEESFDWIVTSDRNSNWKQSSYG